MAKKFALSFLVLGLYSFAFGQLNYGFKAGVTQSFFKESIASTYKDMNLKTGFQVGAFLDYQLVKSLSVRPSLEMTQKGFKSVEGKEEGPFYWNRSFSLTYLELPIDVVYSIPVGKATTFFIGTGPVLSAGLFGKGKGTLKGTDGAGQLYIQQGFNNKPFKKPGGYKTFDLGADFLTGIQFSKMILTANYNYGLMNILTYD